MHLQVRSHFALKPLQLSPEHATESSKTRLNTPCIIYTLFIVRVQWSVHKNWKKKNARSILKQLQISKLDYYVPVSVPQTDF
jgi:hypothetical protein